MESDEQKEFVRWFRATYYAHRQALRISLRGLNFGSGARAARMINHIKSQGSVDGEADLAILLPRGEYGSFICEHKGQGMAHKTTDKQQDYLDYHNKIGNLAISTRGLEELKASVATYMGQ